MYLTPRRLHLMKLISSPVCELCPNGDTGTFLQMYWTCPGVVYFWKMVATTFSDLLDIKLSYCPKLLLLIDTSSLDLSFH